MKMAIANPTMSDAPYSAGRRPARRECAVQGKQMVKLAAFRPRSHRRQKELAAAMKARVFVTLKPGVLDPQGKAIHHALEGLGFAGVQDVRAGKLIELELADGTSDADIEAMCRKLLANTVIENFRIERLESVER
jgi:phosphoribosylformylglycinamidine synthase